MGGTAWVTLATNDSYALGALVVANSLKKVGTIHDLVILITPGVTLAMKNELIRVFNFVKEVDVFDSNDSENLKLLSRPDLGITFTKIHAWKLTQYSKCVFLDADTLIIQNADELFDREEFSAAPDAGWPDCFNSGVFVFRPSEATYYALVEFALINGSFDGGDQGLLNSYFSDWATGDSSKRLSFIYNMCSTSFYSYLPALKQFGSKVKIIHFIGSSKPWLQKIDSSTRTVSSDSNHLQNFLQLWWDIFIANVHPTLTTEMSGLARALAQIPIGSAVSAEQLAYEDHIHRQHWEEGHIDYTGKDSWDNIWKKISQTIDPVKPAAPETVSSSEPLPATTPAESHAKEPITAPKTIPTEIVTSAPPISVIEPIQPITPAPEKEPVTNASQSDVATAPQITPTTEPSSIVSTTPQTPPVTEAPQPVIPAPQTQITTEKPIESVPPQTQPITEPSKPDISAVKPEPTSQPPQPVVLTPEAITPVPEVKPVLQAVAEEKIGPLVTEKPEEPKSEVVADKKITPPGTEKPEEPKSEVVAEKKITPSGTEKPEEPKSETVVASAIPPALSKVTTAPGTPQVTPSTPTVTEPTPPQSPLSAVAAQLEKLDIDPSVPDTPPAGSEPPIPPKRKGSKGQTHPEQSKTGEGAKGKGKK